MLTPDDLTSDDALALCAAARSAAEDLGVPMTFAVMDPGGHLVALVRMDGAAWITATVAQGKAWTAAAYGTPSAAQKEKMASMPNFAGALTTMTHGSYTPQTGAVPVYSGGRLLGALGASGGTGEQDEAVVTAAVQATGASISA
ncbi:MAG TPA: heme-binding protein [Mycobacteriales bacterium]|nr:heme-binding protein [Mycobacteriales bacterium]